MRILIGGSPSTGSSVFRQILNRHPKVYCGPETFLLCYAELYEHWKRERTRILLPGYLGLFHADARLIRGVHPVNSEIGWSAREIRDLVTSKRSFTGFCDTFFGKPMGRTGKEHWAEKTPANVLQFPRFLKLFEEAWIIHMVRNPYDTIASLVARGMSVYEATSVYLVYTSHGLAAREMTGYLEMKYEDLISDPAGTLETDILQPLELTFEPAMLTAGNVEMTGQTRMQGWRQDELSELSSASISRFDDEKNETRERIIAACNALQLDAKYMKRFHLQHASVHEICSELNYPAYTENLTGMKLDEERWQSQQKYWFPRLFSAWRKDPVVIETG